MVHITMSVLSVNTLVNLNLLPVPYLLNTVDTTTHCSVQTIVRAKILIGFTAQFTLDELYAFMQSEPD